MSINLLGGIAIALVLSCLDVPLGEAVIAGALWYIGYGISSMVREMRK